MRARLLSCVSEARTRGDKNEWQFEGMSDRALSASDLSSSDLISTDSRILALKTKWIYLTFD